MMKILQIISVGHIAGGAEKSVALLKESLVKAGHEVLVIASDHTKDTTSQFSDIEYTEIDSVDKSLSAKLAHHLWYPASYTAITEAIESFQPDVVHFHTLGQLSPSAIYAVRNTPAVLTVHGPEEYTTSLLEWYLPAKLFKKQSIDLRNLTILGRLYYWYFRYCQRPIYKFVFKKRLKYLIAPSKYMQQVLHEEAYGVPVKQIYNGIALPKPKTISKRRSLLYVGRLEHVKGVDVLLEALLKAKDRIPDVHLGIVGDGRSRQALEQFVTRHGLRRNVTFYGWLQSDAVLQKYYESTAVCIPSIWPENLPTVCIEALAAGRPVIGSRTGGIPELVTDGKSGKIVEAGDSDQLSEAIVSLLTTKHLKTYSDNAAKTARMFAIDRFIKDIEKVYEEIA